MQKNRTDLEYAIGKLIVALQQEWDRHGGEIDLWQETEAVICRGNDLLQHAKAGDLVSVLNGSPIEEYLGRDWVKRHPQIRHFIRNIEKLLN